ncbi:DNA cytosine methyltransferase [uncultured Faecalicoccus sp.]|uniref:DNA cytosine methyltransferase n=1 Tax=uncultured Faecalicoccus sp. TaxID=1971760 RepID=UPI00258E6957|nr:DNA (cytosine-5-)-methyltransferase [uncultured Faecalicoccus sp.]
MKKIRMIDLFSGCGGLSEGFMNTGKYTEIAAVEWLKPQVETLRKRMSEKWGEKHANDRVIHFDIQREKELFHGWSQDPQYGTSRGLDYFVNRAKGIDIIVGGPPCQAYSVAGRVRDEKGMKDDYRNYLFEHYLSVVNRYRPKLFVFENVPGILSASPDGEAITDKIEKGFANIGYEILGDLKKALVNASDYGVPQNRKRIIIVGLNKDYFRDPQNTLNLFYSKYLPEEKSDKKISVKEAIGDLPKCTPYFDEEHHNRRISHKTPKCDVSWHVPRYSNPRDMDTFRLLAEDLASGKRKFNSHRISKLYEEKVGSKSPIHRYHVLDPDEPSTTIIAHLYKDGNRFIHYDPSQQRTITVREAARLQTFPDDFEFVGSRGSAYQMIGNAVPVVLAEKIANAVVKLLGGK